MLRAIVRSAVRRGHVEVSLDLDRAAGTVQVRRNDFLLAALVKNFREAAERHGVVGEPDLNGMLRVPGVMTTEAPPRVVDAAAIEEAAVTLMERFNDAREAWKERHSRLGSTAGWIVSWFSLERWRCSARVCGRRILSG